MTDNAKEPAAPADDGTIVFPLRTEIPVFDQKVKELRFRRPTGDDLIQIGNPVIFDPISDPPRVTHDMPRMAAMLSRLAGLPAGSINKLMPEDLVDAAWSVSRFFIPRAG